MGLSKELDVKKIVPEQTVLLEPLHGNSPRKGRFDFWVLTRAGKTLGFEILSRPSHGKMKQKLSYAKETDEFVFVLPSTAFEFYRKNQRHGFLVHARKIFFSSEFSFPWLQVWLVNPKSGKIEQKSVFSRIFNTK